jgi:hypothetical protein
MDEKMEDMDDIGDWQERGVVCLHNHIKLVYFIYRSVSTS